MGAYDKFETNTSVEEEGVWLDYEGEFGIRVARAGGSNKRFIKRMEHYARKYRRLVQRNLMDARLSRKIDLDTFVDCVIVNWRGAEQRQDDGSVTYGPFLGKDGQPLEFTKENVRKVMEDLPDLFDDVKAMASELELFKSDIDEADSKN